MRAGSLLSRVQRVEGVLSPRGDIVVVPIHACQTEDALEARGQAALGRPWHDGDLLVLITMQGPCPQEPHAHPDRVIVSPRKD